MQNCRTCDTPLQGKFCTNCGEKRYVETDYTIRKFISQTIDVFTHFDGKFFLSMKYLLFYPGQLTLEYLAGRRVKLMKPVQLYIIVAVAFFLLFKNWDVFFTRTQYLVLQKPKTEKPVYFKEGKLKGTALDLKNYISNKAEKKGLTFEEMVFKIDSKTPEISKAFLFLLIPALGLFLFIIGFKKYKFYAQHVFHATHIFTFLLATSVIWIGFYELLLKVTKWPINYSIVFLPVILMFILYALVSIKRVYQYNWIFTIVGTTFFILSTVLAISQYSRLITYLSVLIA